MKSPKQEIIHISVLIKLDGTMQSHTNLIKCVVRQKGNNKIAHVAFNDRPIVEEMGKLFVVTAAIEAKSHSFFDMLNNA